jgi:hypothetical protein
MFQDKLNEKKKEKTMDISKNSNKIYTHHDVIALIGYKQTKLQTWP